jgi:hypothetical protein
VLIYGKETETEHVADMQDSLFDSNQQRILLLIFFGNKNELQLTTDMKSDASKEAALK